MPQGKQAKILSPRQERSILNNLKDPIFTRHSLRDQAMFLLSVKAGLRAIEIAGLTWEMVTTSEGTVGTAIALENRASKGKTGGRTIPLNDRLREALTALHAERGDQARPDQPVIYSQQGGGLTAGTVTVWFHTLYNGKELKAEGCSSHSGRRTFITRAAKKIVESGGSLRDVQQLAGHSSLTMTQRYIEGSNEAKQKVVNLI